MKSEISTAVQVILAHRCADESELVTHITSAIGDADLAERLVEFLPLAFGRVILARVGVELPDCFVRAIGNDEFSDKCPLDAEPVWLPAKAFAQHAAACMSNEDFLSIACRSAEFDAVNNACNAGSDPKDLFGLPPILWRAAPMPTPRPKKSWRFWK